MTAEPLRCPRCGVTFALVVGEVGPCEPCEIELRAEREAMRETVSRPHSCESCGREIVGRRRFCNGTCRTAAWRCRQTAAV